MSQVPFPRFNARAMACDSTRRFPSTRTSVMRSDSSRAGESVSSCARAVSGAETVATSNDDNMAKRREFTAKGRLL